MKILIILMVILVYFAIALPLGSWLGAHIRKKANEQTKDPESWPWN